MKQKNPVLMQQLWADYQAIKQQGSPLLACQGMFVPHGKEDMRFLIKSGMRPMVTNSDPAEAPYAGGFTGIVAGIPQTKYSGTLQIIETEAGHVQQFAEWVVANGGMFDATYFDGRADRWNAMYELYNVALRFDQAEFDSESRSQVMTISCPCDFNYFGVTAKLGSNDTSFAGDFVSETSKTLLNMLQQVATDAMKGVASQGLFMDL